MLTQKKTLLKKLVRRYSSGVTSKQAREWGINQPRKRVYDLRQEGVDIVTYGRYSSKTGKLEWFYHLEG